MMWNEKTVYVWKYLNNVKIFRYRYRFSIHLSFLYNVYNIEPACSRVQVVDDTGIHVLEWQMKSLVKFENLVIGDPSNKYV